MGFIAHQGFVTQGFPFGGSGSGGGPAPSYPAIVRMAAVGDSLIRGSNYTVFSSTGTNWWAGGSLTSVRTILGHRVAFEQNPITGEYTFGVNGAKSSAFLTGGAQRATFVAALDSDADTIPLLVGINDLVDVAETVAAVRTRILALWQEVIDNGQSPIGFEVLPVRSDHASIAFYPAKQQELNALLRQDAADMGVQFIRWASVISQSPGIAQNRYMGDEAHFNILGGMELSAYFANAIAPRATGDSLLEIPASNASTWITPNPYGIGTPGTGMETGWDANATSGVTLNRYTEARGDGVSGNWHVVEFSGMNDAGILLSNPTVFGQIFTSNFAISATPGDKLIAVAEVEMESDFWNVGLELQVPASTLKAGDYGTNGGLAGISEKPRRVNGLLLSEEFTYASGSSALCLLRVFGDGKIKVGRMGVFKVQGEFTPASIPDLKQWLDASDNATLLNESSLPVADGGSIARWADKSGNGNDVIQGLAGSRPTYDADGGVGGLPAVAFNGSQGFSDAYVNPTNEITTFTVYNTPTASSFRGVASTNGNGSATQLSEFARMTNPQWGTFDGAARYATSTTVGAGRVKTCIRRVLAGTIEYFLNGVADGTAPGSTGQNGHLGGAVGQQITGVMELRLVYSRALTDVEKAQLVAYINTRFP